MLENRTFELDHTSIKGGSMSGQSKVLSLSATKGDYGGLVKLSWEVQQVGANATRYEVMRSTKGQGKWATIYKTSGTATSYSCEDNTALPGQCYDYKVVSITNCEGTDLRLEMSDDGFCRSTGIVSGRITYGTGTAVADTRVNLIRNNENANEASQFYSLRTNGTGDGVFLALSNEELNTQFGKMPFSMQMFVRPDENQQGNFVIRGVPFNGDGTNYTIVPTKGIHEFSPSYSSRYVSASSLIHNSVDFTDVSSFPVSGKIYYAGTDYPVEGCSFYVDGDICSKDNELIESAEDGSYTISVPIGDHFIQVKKNGHTFASNGRYPADPNAVGTKMTFDRKVDNLEFYDNTLVNFTGRIVGGDIEGKKPIGFGESKNNIGITELVLPPLADRYRLNVVKETNGTSYSYETNNEIITCESATEAINSKSWRGAGEDQVLSPWHHHHGSYYADRGAAD